MGVYMIFFLEGLQRCNPGDASILLATSPIWTMVFEVVLRQDVFRLKAILGGVVALAGVGIVVAQATNSIGTSLLGVVLMLVSAVCWAASVALSKPLLKDHSPLALVTMSMPVALLVLIPYGLFPALSTSWSTLTVVQWGYFLHLSLLAGALGFFGFFTGVRQVGPSGAMLYQFFVPVFAVVTAHLVLGEPITLQKVLGVLVVIGGVAISSKARQDATAEAQKILPSAE
jgi:drug/metabolite transporter (DMT)-like permease